MRGLWAVVFVSLMFAGCVQEAEEPPAPSSGSREGSRETASLSPMPVPSHPPGGTAVQQGWAAPVEVVVPIDWNGTMGTRLTICVTACITQSIAGQAGDTDLLVESTNTTLRAVSLRFTWEATHEANRELAMGTMVMRTCGHCEAESTYFEEVTGPSPLEVDLTDLDVHITADHVFHAYVWNPLLYAWERPVLVHGSLEQPFRIVGSLTVSDPPA